MESKGGGYYKRAPQTREGGRKGRRRGRSDGGGHVYRSPWGNGT